MTNKEAPAEAPCERLDFDNDAVVWISERGLAALDSETFSARLSPAQETGDMAREAITKKLDEGKPLAKSIGMGADTLKLPKVTRVTVVRDAGVLSVNAGRGSQAATWLGRCAPEAFDLLRQRLAPNVTVERGRAGLQDMPLDAKALLIALFGIVVFVGLAYGAAVGPQGLADISVIRQMRWLRTAVAAGASIGSTGFAVLAGISFVCLAVYLVLWQRGLPDKEFFDVPKSA